MMRNRILILAAIFLIANLDMSEGQIGASCRSTSDCRGSQCPGSSEWYCNLYSAYSSGICECRRKPSSSTGLVLASILPAIIIPSICFIIFVIIAIRFCVVRSRRSREEREAAEALARQRQQQIAAASRPVTVVQQSYYNPEPHNTTNYPIQSAYVQQPVYPQPNNYAQPTTGGFAAQPIPQPYYNPNSLPYPSDGAPQFHNPYPDGVPPQGHSPTSVIPSYNPEYKPGHDSTIS
eukprot:TRINITY_DN6987_c0_g1_i1.p1 TRINITY_DN6987_c0_g1~~TRINITY_DN6987_c0_g1_i1.p1  ORF type:complete len:235 (-),score=46.95 TRINITY_DN6987_c0_g1_i1:32-736(-)